MNDKMTVAFVKKTGHVLAVFTRNADSGGKPSVGALVGAGIPVRDNKKVTVVVPPDALDSTLVNYDLDVFEWPLSFAAGGGIVAKLGTPVPLSDTGANVANVALATNAITIKLDIAPAPNTSVWVQVEEADRAPENAPELRIMEDEFKAVAGGTVSLTVILPLTMPAGPRASLPTSTPQKKYNILVLVGGYQARFLTRLL
jgi:hypothetical protein